MTRHPVVWGISILLALSAMVSPTSAAAETCYTYDVVGARGTEAPPQDTDGDGVITSLQYLNAPDDARGVITDTFRSVFDDLVLGQGGSVSSYGVRYLAKGGLPLFGKFVPNLEAEWNASYEDGSADVAEHINDVFGSCPATKFVLIGYSQGAEVMAGAIPLLPTAQENQVAAVVLFGDPEFNGTDVEANRGAYSSSRFGMWGARDAWSSVTDAPVFSYCNHGDVACQGGMREIPVDGVTQPLDLLGLSYWADRRYGNPFAIDREHAEYQFSDAGITAAYDVADALALPFSGDDDPALDVVFLVDTTSKMTVAIDELQIRGEELTDFVNGVNENSRFAVVEFKGHGSGNSFDTNVAEDFTNDPGDVLDAFDGLTASGGTPVPPGYAPQAAGYSGVVAAAELDWRPFARKVVLLISGNRVGDADPNGTESGSSLTQGDVASAMAAVGARLYSVSWSDNFYNGLWESPISWRSTRISENQSIVDKGLEFLEPAILEPYVQVLGPITAMAGDELEFSADLTRSVVTGEEIVYHWQACMENPGGGDTRRSSSTDPETCGYAEETDPDEGTRQTLEFAVPGDYLVEVRATTAASLNRWGSDSVRVHILPVADDRPPAPRLALSYASGTLSMTITPGSGDDPTELWALKNPQGDVQALFTMPDGAFEVEIDDLTATESVGWTIDARNSEGDSPPFVEVPAESATYVHRTDSDDGPLGGTLTIEGQMTNALETVRDDHSGPGPIVIADDYDATFSTEDGWDVGYPMADADAEVDLGATTWSVSFNFADDLDVDGNLFWSTMRSGLAGSLLATGGVSVELDGEPFHLRIDPSTLTEEINAGVIDPIASPPNGVAMDVLSADSGWPGMAMEYVGAIDTGLFPAASETTDPETYDWSTAEITDVRVYIGTKEFENHGTVFIQQANPTTGIIFIEFQGDVGTGSAATMRSFLQAGTITFRVNGGALNSVELSETPSAAEALWDDLE